MEINKESYILYKGYQRMSVSHYEKLQQDYKTAKCYYYHWRSKVVRLSRIVYPDSQLGFWTLLNLPLLLHIGYDLIKERVEYDYETKNLIKLYKELKFQKYGLG